jgi:hypothetical protein
MIRIRRRKNIICNITPYISCVIRPPRDRGHTLHLADHISLRQKPARIRIALDVVLTASPRPLGAPGYGRVGRAVYVGALRPGGCLSDAPEVVEDLVFGGGIVGVLRAEADFLLNGGGVAGCCGCATFESCAEAC